MSKLKRIYEHFTCALCGGSIKIENDSVENDNLATSEHGESTAKLCPYCSRTELTHKTKKTRRSDG